MTSVVFLETMEDFYGFTFGGHKALTPIAALVVYSVTYGIGKVLLAWNRKNLGR